MVLAISSLIVAVLGGLFLVLLPAIGIGALTLLTYRALTKVRPVVGRLAPVVVGLFLSVLAPVVSPFSLPVAVLILVMGVLTPFMPAGRYFPDRYRYPILLLGSVIAVSGRLLYGFAMAFGGGGESPLLRLLGSVASSDAGFLIVNSVALYLETVLLSALIFGSMLVATVTFRKLRGGQTR